MPDSDKNSVLERKLDFLRSELKDRAGYPMDKRQASEDAALLCLYAELGGALEAPEASHLLDNNCSTPTLDVYASSLSRVAEFVFPLRGSDKSDKKKRTLVWAAIAERLFHCAESMPQGFPKARTYAQAFECYSPGSVYATRFILQRKACLNRLREAILALPSVGLTGAQAQDKLFYLQKLLNYAPQLGEEQETIKAPLRAEYLKTVDASDDPAWQLFYLSQAFANVESDGYTHDEVVARMCIAAAKTPEIEDPDRRCEVVAEAADHLISVLQDPKLAIDRDTPAEVLLKLAEVLKDPFCRSQAKFFAADNTSVEPDAEALYAAWLASTAEIKDLPQRFNALVQGAQRMCRAPKLKQRAFRQAYYVCCDMNTFDDEKRLQLIKLAQLTPKDAELQTAIAEALEQMGPEFSYKVALSAPCRLAEAARAALEKKLSQALGCQTSVPSAAEPSLQSPQTSEPSVSPVAPTQATPKRATPDTPAL